MEDVQWKVESGRYPAKCISSNPSGLTCHLEQLIFHVLLAPGAPKSIPISRTSPLPLDVDRREHLDIDGA